MKFLASMMAFASNFFRVWAEAGRPKWEFRIRFSVGKRGWLIEVHEHGDQRWNPMTKNVESESHVLKFDTYQKAHAHVSGLGLHLAYEQAYFTRDRKPLHPAANTLENAIVDATAGTGIGRLRAVQRSATPALTR